ncbi:hypothetical protein FNF29_05328 [Cafeteria roenbergensis]|uniref:Uncharacterized protein n=1 Tax=Cafeteria roenbergensis TaxID=33653 RepID=A0A5A8CB39_CAFRO|nr:hypothetical protein FNF29_05328 [Cafeteria roenbergensis]|eukprot:KAA0150316.1 hypothetical protein FNF29_05328 [Cafeteria roenbergensis]
MGIVQSAPVPADVDLLPPRFDSPPPNLARVTASPFEYMFGASARHALFSNFFAEDRARIRVHLAPPNDDRIRVAADVQERDGMLKSASMGVSMVEATPAGQIVEACATVGADEPFTLRATGMDPKLGLAAYARVPVSDSLSRRVRKVDAGRAGEAASPDSRSAAARGSPSLLVGRPSNAYHVVSGDLSGLAPKDASAARREGAEDPSDAPARASEWPEFGFVWAGRSGAGAGAHVGAGPGRPAKAWTVMRHGGLSAGVQASLFLDRAVEAVTSGKGAVIDGLSGSFKLPGSSAGAPRVPVHVDAALSLSMPPVYDAALVLDAARRDVVLSYMHHTTLRRDVRNVFEDSHVKGIFNYVDFGVEFRQPLERERPFGMTLAAAWQLNSKLLAKARAGTSGAAVSLAFRSWTQPDVALTVSGGLRPAGGAGASLFTSPGVPYTGVFLSLGNAAAPPTYRKMLRSEAREAPIRRFVADPSLNAERSSVVEQSSTRIGTMTARRPQAGGFDDIIPGVGQRR